MTEPTISKITTIAAVRAAKPEQIFYSATTCWWTHRRDDLCVTGDAKTHIPCDPRGGMLFETDKVEDFLAAAESAATRFGRHGIAAFEAAHNDNCSLNGRPWCMREWDEYNHALDAAAKHTAGG